MLCITYGAWLYIECPGCGGGGVCRLNEVLDFAGPVSLVEVVDVYGFN